MDGQATLCGKEKITDSEWTAKGIKRERGRAFRRVPRWGNQTFKERLTISVAVIASESVAPVIGSLV
jgi:hypothetical protein